jgi:hypothetical protein
MRQFGDRVGNQVWVKSPLKRVDNIDGIWVDVTTGEHSTILNEYKCHVEKAVPFNKVKPRYVNFVRYLRPYKWDGNFTRTEVDNLRGTTFAISLDYEFQTISFAYSVCNGDNFDKSVGKAIATQRIKNYEIHSIPMVDGKINELGVLMDIYKAIYNSPACSERTKMLKEFYDAGF